MIYCAVIHHPGGDTSCGAQEEPFGAHSASFYCSWVPFLIYSLSHVVSYLDTAEHLQREANLKLKGVEIADNVDLMTVIQVC